MSSPARARGRRAAATGVPALCAGGLLALSLPPWGWWPLGFCGAALLAWRLGGLGWRGRLWAGWLAGMGSFVPGLWWAGAFNWYGAALLMVVEALFVAAGALAVPGRRGRLPAVVGAMTLAEAARMAWPFGGLPLGGVFLGHAAGPLLPAARLGGPLALTAGVWLAGAGGATVAGAALGARRARSPAGRPEAPTRHVHAPAGRAVAGGLSALALAVALGLAGALAPAGGAVVGRLTVAAVQGGGRRGTTALRTDPARVFAAQVAATRRLLGRAQRSPRPSLVVWPEDVVALDTASLTGSPQAAVVGTLARRLDATVVAGVTETVSATAFRNEAVAWGPDGRVVGRYEKVRRVPFGEYVPDRAFFAHFANLSAVPLDAVPGHGTGLLPTPAAPIGVMISYEVFFADRGRAAVRAGAELLVVPTNTSSYATTQVPSLEVAADRVQAVAEGRTLVQAAPAGYSAVVDPAGTVLERSVLGARQVLVTAVGLRRGTTVYARVGDAGVLAAAAAALVAGWALALGDRRPRRRTQA